MTNDAEVRQRLRSHLFGSVAELADLDFQRSTWLKPPTPSPHFSFVEFFETFYDVTGGGYQIGDPDADGAPMKYLVDEGHISTRERDAIWPVHLALQGYWPSDPYDHQAILDDPRWQHVCRIAREAQTELAGSLVDPAERSYFDLAEYRCREA